MGAPRRRRGRRGLLGERLRQVRETRGLTQETAAAELGVSRVQLARWETGEQRPVGLARRWVELWIAVQLGEPPVLPAVAGGGEQEARP